ncbi:PAS domain-containing hybrid sensor histidine kinase/response regulator [Aliidiomarina indica]|uniref:PAS domain-containing hybrid sensor histidine kinase/response regulator n=1 Tax=Aliidiomarina indica TaxID=2749147 RepID=UPI001E3EA702|nr:PAS domain-containing hybrid sensor histidine kinase/response regulator [Aliidiomarina indica]
MNERFQQLNQWIHRYFGVLLLVLVVLLLWLPAPWHFIAIFMGLLLALSHGVFRRQNAAAIASPSPENETAQASDLGFSEVNEQLLQHVFNDLPIRVYWRDRDMRFIGANPGFLRDFDIQDIRGLRDEDIPQLNANSGLRARDLQTFSLRSAACNQEMQLNLSHDEAQTRWVEHSSVPLYDEQGQIVGVLGSYYDISSIKRASEEMSQARESAEKARAEAEAANLAKSDFLANMSHEIRTPINAIVGMANLAMKTDLNDKQQRYIKVIDSSSQALLGVINDILDFSKIEANKLTIERIPFDLDEVLGTLADMFAYKAYDKGLEFIINLPANIPTLLVGDPLRLQQVLINLVSNAIKFTEDGEINVSCTLLDQNDEKVWLRIEVKDTGMGMTPEQSAQLFQAFTQADSSTTRKFGGTGLGLTISKRLVTLMQGDIGVSSSPGQGSNFFIELVLPLQESQDRSHHQLLMQRLEGVRVLAVDDNTSTREMLKETLRSYQMDAHTCHSAEQALRKLQEGIATEKPFQLALIDWRLPGMDGLALVEQVKEKLPQDFQPRMILATGYYAEELAEKARQVGTDDFITKPYTTATLARVMTSALFGARVAAKDSAKTSLIPDNLQGAPLLVVEDNEINQHVAKEMLSGHGFQVDIAENGEVAVQKVQEKSYALVLMDIQMPVMDGYRASETIRQFYSYQQLPILAMTANAMSGDAERSLAAGMQGHIPKPIDEQLLLSQISKWALAGPYSKLTPTSETKEAKTTEPSSRRYPQIKGMDLEQALQRLNHNVGLYVRLLEQLVSSYRGSAIKVSEFISRGQHDEARRYFHSLKGAAANLGLTALTKKAGTLETAIVNRDVGLVADQITGLESLLDLVEQAIEDLHTSESAEN